MSRKVYPVLVYVALNALLIAYGDQMGARTWCAAGIFMVGAWLGRIQGRERAIVIQQTSVGKNEFFDKLLGNAGEGAAENPEIGRQP